jgi:PKD repeat protein
MFTTFWDRLRKYRLPRARPAQHSRAKLTLETLENRSLPSATLVASYSFNEGSGTLAHDLSGHNNNGTVSGPKWTNAGKYGGALSFDGNNDAVTVADSSLLRLTSGMTIEAWVNPAGSSDSNGHDDNHKDGSKTASDGLSAVIDKSGPKTPSYGLFADSGPGSHPSVYLTSGGRQYGTASDITIGNGKWYFLAATYDGKTLSFYVNGVLGASRSVMGAMDVSSGALRIGGDSTWGQYFKGVIDEVRIYDGALTAAQIGLDMATPLSGPLSPAAPPPRASAGANQDTVEGQAVAFSGSVTGGAAPFTYQWTFGDGGTTSGTLTPSHTYATDGTYNATLTVIDGQGRSSSSTTRVTVKDAPPTVNVGGPYSGTPGVTVAFSGTATDPDPTDTLTYSWNFGDGTSAKAPTASHSYATAGIYGVILTVTDQQGASTTAATTVTVSTMSAVPSMALPLVKNGAVATNGDGDPYPNEYGGDGFGTEGGTATVGVNTANSITGAAVDMHLTAGQLYAEFNPYNYAGNPAYPSPRGWAQDYSANPTQWQDNTYNRMSFWVYVPTTDTAFTTDGSQGWEFGTYVKQITNPDLTSDEVGGEHYYHLLNLPNLGTWVQVVINTHPDHRRGDPGSTDPGVVTYPTTSTYGGDDPANTYNYFDTLTRFYLQQPYTAPSAYPADYLIDGIQFYQDPYQENDAQVYNLTGTYRASDNQLAVTWNRDKAEDTVNQEVRYAFSDIHQLGWANATAAPNGTITPPGGGAYNNMVYDTTGINMAGHSVVYIAIKPQNSDLFTEIAVPLDPTNGGAGLAMPGGSVGGPVSGGKVAQTSAADFKAGINFGTAVTNSAGGELRLAQECRGFVTLGAFLSAPLDAGKSVSWGTANWSASLPPGTTVTLLTRTGNSATPDSTWSRWSLVSNNGKVASPAGRYLQYAVVLTTCDPALTPTVYDVSFLWS